MYIKKNFKNFSVQEIDDNTKTTDDLHMEVEESTTTDNEAQ